MNEVWQKITTPFRAHAEWWNDYLTEISVIIISLAATYYGDSLVESYMEKLEDKEAIGMVRHELTANLAELREIEAFYRKEIAFSDELKKALLIKTRPEEDSIRSYYNQHRLYYYWFLKDNAFSMLRESGSLSRLDKPLLMQLFECYEQIEVVKDMEKRYREEKFAHLTHYIDGLGIEPNAESTRGQWEQIDRHPAFRQYLFTLLPMLAKSSLGINLRAQELIGNMLFTIDEAFPPEESTDEPSGN